MATQTFILATCLVALIQVYFAASQCNNPKEFLQCVRQDADVNCEKIAQAIENRKEARKQKMADCFTNADCDPPTENDEVDQDGPPGMEEKKKCFEDAKERIKNRMKSQMEQCLGEDLPDEMEGPCGMGKDGPGGFMSKAKKAGKAICTSYEACDKKESVKQCVQREIDAAKQDFQKNFEDKCVNRGMRLYQSFCGKGNKVDECEAESQNSGCKEAIGDKREKFCRCRIQLRSQAKSLIKSEMEQCFPKPQGLAGLLMGNVQDALKTCFESNADSEFGAEADQVCENRGCPDTQDEDEVRERIRSKCREMQDRMEAKKEEMKSCMKDNLPRLVANRIPEKEGGYLDFCSLMSGRQRGGVLSRFIGG